MRCDEKENVAYTFFEETRSTEAIYNPKDSNLT